VAAKECRASDPGAELEPTDDPALAVGPATIEIWVVYGPRSPSKAISGGPITLPN
jgi:hypothetical protein